MKRSVKLGAIITLASVFAFVSMSQLGLFKTTNVNAITAVYALDINPSFELSVNKQDKVVLITAVNDDAKTIRVEDLYGKDSTFVIEELLRRAKDAGYIDDTDLVEDYAVITVIPMGIEDEDQTDELEVKLDKRIKDSEFLQGLNVALIKADLVALREAQGKKIPIGLYVINGMVVQLDGTYISAKDFFSNPEYRATFQTKGEIKEAKLDHIKTLILKALDKLDAASVDTAALRVKLSATTDDELVNLMVEVRSLKKDHKLTNPAEDKAIERGKPVKPDKPNK